MFTFLLASSLSLMYLLFHVGIGARVLICLSTCHPGSHLYLSFLSSSFASPFTYILTLAHNVAHSQARPIWFAVQM